jgi:cytochrome P450
VLLNVTTFSNQLQAAQADDPWGPNLLGMDGDEHYAYRRRLRAALADEPTDGQDRWRGELNAVFDRIIGQFDGAPRVDLYSQYCALFPVMSSCEASALGPGETEVLQRWVFDLGERQTTDSQEAEVLSLLRELIRQRRARPGRDPLGRFATAAGSRWISDPEMVRLAGLFVSGGSGTTYRSLALLILAVLQRPALLEQLRRDSGLMPQFVDEVIRWEPPVSYLRRYATVDTTLDGLSIPAGATVMVSLTAANHDPRRWEDPHQFDPLRNRRRNLGMGVGPHLCLGARFAREFLTVGLERLIRSFPAITLDQDEDEPVVMGSIFRRPSALPVVLRRPSGST